MPVVWPRCCCFCCCCCCCCCCCYYCAVFLITPSFFTHIYHVIAFCCASGLAALLLASLSCFMICCNYERNIGETGKSFVTHPFHNNSAVTHPLGSHSESLFFSTPWLPSFLSCRVTEFEKRLEFGPSSSGSISLNTNNRSTANPEIRF